MMAASTAPCSKKARALALAAASVGHEGVLDGVSNSEATISTACPSPPVLPSSLPMHFRQRDVAATVADMQARRYRDMSPAEKLARADALHDLAWEAASAGVRMRHPELDENAVHLKVRELFRHAPD